MSQIQENTLNETLARKALEALVVDNPDLERLEALLERFNIFEAIGAVRQEVRHSDFLAFLLTPQQNHGLGDAFLKRLIY
ncbi:MAG TPA: PD-(D/E)XK nuclease family protein [Ktedonobacterales bacterium]|nr:PD-(D/E)XK nuclease family protein [Ktedonobacterales bacterium]